MRPGRALLVLGTTGALLTGGAVLAYAGWSSTTDSATFTVPAARLPTVARPTVLLPVDGLTVPPRVAWRPVDPTTGPDVQRYVVTRHAGPDAAVACTVAATQLTACLDAGAPAGIPLTYTVAAARGTYWTGPDSEPSPAVTVPGPVAAPAASSSPAASAPPSPGIPPTGAPPTGDAPTGEATTGVTLRPSPSADPTTGPTASSSAGPPADAASVPTADPPPPPSKVSASPAGPAPSATLSPGGR